MADTLIMVKDAVCGKELDPKAAMYTSNYNGKTYYFCSEGCKREFDVNPEKFAK